MFAASKSGSVDAKDPKFNYVTMLLHGNGTNGAQNNTFVDSSTNNFTITRNGNTTQGTFTPYGSNWSNYFGSANYFSSSSNAAFALGTGDFTVEAWVFPDSAYTTYNYVLSVAVTNGLVFYVTGGNLVVRAFNTGDLLSSATIPALNTWTHVAATRSGTTLRIFVNGVQTASTTNSTNFAQGAVYAGNDSTNAAPWYGYISNLRLVKGTAVYTSNFTPSTTPLTAVSGTSWLVCQSNRFIDNSSNAFTITTSGSPSVQRFSPFSPTTAYSTSVIGGSGYFDGSGDYLTIPDNSAWVVNTDYTVEFWCYASSFPGQYNNVFNQRESPSLYWGVNWDTSLGWCFFWNNGSGETKISRNQNSPLNTWVHVAIVKSGTTGYMFLNGVQAGASFTLGSINDMASLLYIGTWPTISDYFAGYISNMRFVKGTALYTSTFTPNTSPLTAITNTVLLLNTANAGILDNAMMNDLETVGNAQISTSVKKYGTGSLAFDGSSNIVFNGSNTVVFGTGDFTIEFWAYVSNAALSGNFLDMRPLTTNGSYPNIYYSATSLGYYVGGLDRITGGTISSNTWFHVAVCRSGTSTKMFLNGTQVGSTYTDSTNYLCGTTRPMIGGNGYLGTSNLNGYIDEYRFSKYARYTSNFTVPTAAFPDKG